MPVPFAEERGQSPDKAPDPFIPEGERGVIEELLKEEGPLAQDEILEFTGLEPSQLPALLLQLEISGSIQKARDGKFTFKRSIRL